MNGRKILTASLICFYEAGFDFVDIAKKVVSSSWQTLFNEIDESGNASAIIYIESFLGASDTNTAGCKQAADDSLKLFATNGKIRRAIRRPEKDGVAIEPSKLEENNIFIVVGEDKLSLYAPLMNVITSQVMQYIGTRVVSADSRTILLALDEFGSLKIEAELILDAVRRFRKRKARILLLTQNSVDLDILYGNDVTRAIISNLRYIALLGGIGEPSSQKYFSELIGYKSAKKISKATNSRQTTTTESEIKEYKIEPAELDRQGKDNLILVAPNEPNGYLKLKKNYYFKN